MASFGYGIGDILSLTKIVWDVIQNTKKATGEHGELTRELNSLHTIVQRLQTETSNSESLINGNPERKEELDVIVSGCTKVLNSMNNIVKKYNALPPGNQKGLKKFFERVRFGNGEMQDLGQWRQKISTHTSMISLFVNMISIGSLGRIEKQMTGELRDIRLAVNQITASFLSTDKEATVFTTYQDDDRAVWKEFRRELLEDGFNSTTISKHKTLIKAYIRELGERGLLDEEIDEPTSSGGGSPSHFTYSDQAPPQTPTPKQAYVEDVEDWSGDDMIYGLGQKAEITGTAVSQGQGQARETPVDNDPITIPTQEADATPNETSSPGEKKSQPDHSAAKLPSNISKTTSSCSDIPPKYCMSPSGRHFYYGSSLLSKIAVHEVRERLSTFVFYDVQPVKQAEDFPDLTMDFDVFLKNSHSTKRLVSTIDSAIPNSTARHHSNSSILSSPFWANENWVTAVISHNKDLIPIPQLWVFTDISKNPKTHVNFLVSAHNTREDNPHFKWRYWGFYAPHQFDYRIDNNGHLHKNAPIVKFTLALERKPFGTINNDALWMEYHNIQSSGIAKGTGNQHSYNRWSRNYLPGFHLLLTTNLMPVSLGENPSVIGKELVLRDYEKKGEDEKGNGKGKGGTKQSTRIFFSCEGCGDVLKGKKLDQHRNRCHGASFTCIDCMVDFYGTSYRNHTTCMTKV